MQKDAQAGRTTLNIVSPLAKIVYYLYYYFSTRLFFLCGDMREGGDVAV